MRLVIVPIITFENIEGESEFVMFRQFARDVTRRFDVFVYMVVPKTARSRIVSERRLWYVFEDETQNFFDTQASVPLSLPELFNPRKGKYVVDAVLTSRTNAAAYMSRLLWDARGDRVPVFIDESMAADFESLVSPVTDDVDLMNRSMGYACAAGNFFDTDLERENALRAARRYMTGSMYRKIEEKSFVIPCGVSIEKLEKAKERVIKSDRFTIGFGGRFNEMKRIDHLVEILSDFYKGGRNARIVLSSPKSEQGFEGILRKQYPELEVFTDVPSHEFVRMAAGWDIMLNTSKIEGFSVGFTEQLYLVPVVIMPKLRWVRDILKEHFDTYPFLYSNFTEAAAMLRWCFDNYEEAKKKCEHIKPWIAKTYDSRIMNERMYEVMRKKAMEEFSSPLFTEGNREVLEKAFLELPGEFGLGDMLKGIVRWSSAYRLEDFKNPRLGKLSQRLVYKWLLSKGVKDDCEGVEPRFRKV